MTALLCGPWRAAGLGNLAAKAPDIFATAAETAPASLPAPKAAAAGMEATTKLNGVETVVGEKVTIEFEGRKCIHARFCVTGAPKVFLANVEGRWILLNAMDAENLVAIAAGMSLRREHGIDGRQNEAPPRSICALCRTRRHRAGRQATGPAHDAQPVRELEEQAVLRWDAQGDRLQKLIVDL